MLFYFTGTGNSLYVAKGLERQPISIPQVMHREDLTFSDDRIGIVAPIYGHEVPAMVQEFLEKATFQTPYFYMILTYGNRHGGAAELAQELCARCGIPVRYINLVHMVDNWLPAFDMEEGQRKDKHVEEQLAAIQSDVAQQVAWIAPVTEADRAAHQAFLAGMRLAPPDVWQHLLRVSQDCIGCGGCIEACPYGARYKHPVTGRADKCDYCRRATPGQVPACVQVCPVRCRVFGDADNPDDPVARALAGNRHVYVVPPDFDAKPTLAYLNGTTPTDWPRRKDVPPALAAIGPLSSVVKAFGGLALFGVIGVFVKQLFWPSDSGKSSDKGDRP